MSNIEQENGSVSYDMLQEQQVDRLLAVPLKKKNKIIGFLGVDNPRNHYDDPTLLSSIQYFIINSIERKEKQHQFVFKGGTSLSKAYHVEYVLWEGTEV